METMLWDINIIPHELDNGYLMLPPGVLHMSALGRFGRFTLFSPRVSHSRHLPVFVLCCVLGLGVFVALWCFWFPVLFPVFLGQKLLTQREEWSILVTFSVTPVPTEHSSDLASPYCGQTVH